MRYLSIAGVVVSKILRKNPQYKQNKQNLLLIVQYIRKKCIHEQKEKKTENKKSQSKQKSRNCKTPNQGAQINSIKSNFHSPKFTGNALELQCNLNNSKELIQYLLYTEKDHHLSIFQYFPNNLEYNN